MKVDDRFFGEECPPTLRQESAALHLRLFEALGSALHEADPYRTFFLHQSLSEGSYPLHIGDDRKLPVNFRT